MANGVQVNKQGPFWPLGSIVVVTPGTPVNVMSLVDPTFLNAPAQITAPGVDEYTSRCNQIIIQGFKTNGGTGLTNNTGNIYVILKGSRSPGTNNRADMGAILLCVTPGLTAVLAAAPMNRNSFNAYHIWIDADNASDAAQVSLVIQ